MIKITVISDSHGNTLALDKMAQIILESDIVFHLGDHFDDMRYLAPVLGDKLYRVHGNCDWGNVKSVEVKVEGHKIFATHGDLYGVKSGTDRLVQIAKSRGCKIALYGHTHVAEIREQNGVLLINPGTLHKFSTRKTFAYIVISGDKVIPTINEKFFEK